MPEKGRAKLCPQISVSRIITRASRLNEIPQSWPQRFRFTKSRLEFRHLPFISNKQSNDIDEP